MSEGRKFNHIYSSLVESENDMIGHIAYSLYKKQKVEYITTFKDKEGRMPEEVELDTFHHASQATISAIKVQATQILSTFMETVLQERIAEIEKETASNHQQTLKNIIEPIIPPPPKGPWAGFWMSVIVKTVQTLVVAIIFFLVIFLTDATDDFWGAVRKWIPESHQENQNTNKDSIK